MIQGTIDTIAFGGSGILRSEGFVIFVPYTAPQDEVTVEIKQKKSSHGFGRVLRVDRPSQLRIKPSCPLFGKCGGCQLQHLNYPAQLEVKRTFVEDALRRISKIDCTVPPVIAAHKQWSYRTHIKLTIRPGEKGLETGFIAEDNRTFLPLHSCPIFQDGQDRFLFSVNLFLRQLSSIGLKEASLRCFKNEDNTYLLVFHFAPKIPKEAETLAKKFCQDHPRCCGILLHSPGNTISCGTVSPTFSVHGLTIEYSPFGFLQNHPEQSALIYETLLKIAGETPTKVLDLYCGIGITSLLFAKEGKEVIGVEAQQETVALAQKNAQKNQVSSTRFLHGKAEELFKGLADSFHPDLLIVNPPRGGLDPQLITSILQTNIPEILYVSCMPATLARDLKLLSSSYQVHSIQPFDMFPQTTHVETVVKLVKTSTSR